MFTGLFCIYSFTTMFIGLFGVHSLTTNIWIKHRRDSDAKKSPTTIEIFCQKKKIQARNADRFLEICQSVDLFFIKALPK